MDRLETHLFCIPDLNPIENFFHLINVKLKKEALEKKITDESLEQFCERVKSTICNYPSKEIDKIIESMDKRVAMIIKAKGQRIRY